MRNPFFTEKRLPFKAGLSLRSKMTGAFLHCMTTARLFEGLIEDPHLHSKFRIPNSAIAFMQSK